MMNNPAFPWTQRVMPRLAISGRLVLQVFIAFALSFSSHAAPCTGLLVSTESEAPVEGSKSCEEAAFSQQNYARVFGHRPKPASSVALDCRRAVKKIIPDAALSGHRLHNNLLAPLRC